MTGLLATASAPNAVVSSRGGGANLRLRGAVPHRPGRGFLHQPGRRPGQGRAQRGVFRARRRGAREARYSGGGPEPLRARERLDDPRASDAARGDRRQATRRPSIWPCTPRAARRIVEQRALPEGGFRHGERDNGDLFLEDTLAMGRAFLALYQATGEREWLKRAESAVGFIERRFRGEPGYLSVPPRAGAVLEPRTQVDENVAVARFGILLTARELAEDPAHLTVVGAKSDPAASNGGMPPRVRCPIPTCATRSSNAPPSSSARTGPVRCRCSRRRTWRGFRGASRAEYFVYSRIPACGGDGCR